MKYYHNCLLSGAEKNVVRMRRGARQGERRVIGSACLAQEALSSAVDQPSSPAPRDWLTSR
jgi:hypothetical protein